MPPKGSTKTPPSAKDATASGLTLISSFFGRPAERRPDADIPAKKRGRPRAPPPLSDRPVLVTFPANGRPSDPARRPREQKDDRDINETAAESHQRLLGFNLGEGVDSHHLWFHFASVLVTFPANGRPSDPARRPREQKDDRLRCFDALGAVSWGGVCCLYHPETTLTHPTPPSPQPSYICTENALRGRKKQKKSMV